MTDLVGQTINQYQILEHLGGGGMAYVYKAYHAGLDVHRAIKVIRPEFANQPGFKERFQREARAVAQLRHPNIVQVHDYGSQDNFYYMVMEFIEGHDLKDMLRRDGAIRPFSQVAEIIEQVAAALNYAHEKGVLHRDIKPANIMLTSQMEVILTDFGIAKMLDQDAQAGQTETGVSIGTPAYMAPEQAQGAPDIGPTADIYSLGIVLYEMLTGKVPFSADTPLAVILKVVNDPMPPPRTFSPDIPDVLQGVVLKATAKKPADRYQTAAAFVDGLKRSLSAEPGTAPAVSAPTVEAKRSPTPKTKASGRKTGWLASGAIGLVLLLCVVSAAVGAGIYYFTRPAPSLATWQFIIDASAGMNETVEGRPKIDIARAALDKELRILPENVNAGLRIYGGQESGLEPCQDTKLLVEPTTGQDGQIISSLAGVTPQGEAPLTEAIVQAVSDFDLSQDTKNSLIIITSGLDTCETEAIDQLETLSRRLGIELDLHLIGLGVQDNTETEQLQELAQAAGGDYYAADNEEQIGRVLRDQISILQGTPVARATATPAPQNTPTTAPTATVAAPSPTPEPVSLNPINLSNTPDGNSTEAQIMFDGQGYLHLVWIDQISEDIETDVLHRYLSPDGNWSEPENLTIDYESLIESSLRLAHSPNGDVCAFFAAAGGPSNVGHSLHSSCFNGATTAEINLVQEDWRDAAPAFDPNGVPHAATINPPGTLIFGEVELVSGRTFLAYQPAFTIDQAGNYHAVWVLQADPFRLEYSLSTDGGQSWSEPEPLTGDEDPAPGWPQLVADEQGNVHLGWSGFGGRNFYRRWTLGEGWGETVEVGANTQGSAWFDLVIDNDSLAHMVWIWTELTYTRQQADGTWTTPQVIFEDPGPASSGRPILAIAADGTRHFVWPGKDKDIYYASLPAK